MDSRATILERIKKNQPALRALPNVPGVSFNHSLKEKFISTLSSIGGVVVEVNSTAAILDFVEKNFSGKNVVTTMDALFDNVQKISASKPHQLDGIHLAILPGRFGVAENGSIWITDQDMGDRALPYITEHLSLVIRESDLVATMHDAYGKIGTASYNLGTFIAGPSKTADIEQSLVLGAHGAKSLIVFLLNA